MPEGRVSSPRSLSCALGMLIVHALFVTKKLDQLFYLLNDRLASCGHAVSSCCAQWHASKTNNTLIWANSLIAQNHWLYDRIIGNWDVE